MKINRHISFAAALLVPRGPLVSSKTCQGIRSERWGQAEVLRQSTIERAKFLVDPIERTAVHKSLVWPGRTATAKFSQLSDVGNSSFGRFA
jgi:hypothetical protein